jgi:hypothetical protein
MRLTFSGFSMNMKWFPPSLSSQQPARSGRSSVRKLEISVPSPLTADGRIRPVVHPSFAFVRATAVTTERAYLGRANGIKCLFARLANSP